MTDDLNPQAAQMADASMVRTLRAQTEAIWPQERALFDRYGLAGRLRVLDAGCGTGEMSARLAERYPEAEVLGVDVLDASLVLARARSAAFGPRVRFENRSVFGLELPDASFDLSVCRHVIHAIPHAERVIAELARVTRPGGRVHVLAEDYGMIHFPPRRFDPNDFWPVASRRFGESTGTDLFVGRRAFEYFRRAGLVDVTVDYVVVDTLRVPRETFAAIWEAWRDGYADVVAAALGVRRDEAVARFDDQIATLRDPERYAAWLVPVVAGVVPGSRAEAMR
ncbi:MAG TPA: class I SAM-dependent methyltransferase [Minicystis sp.]|nr:class I SAM-dependent methyltransferase [Minicystis sp.]